MTCFFPVFVRVCVCVAGYSVAPFYHFLPSWSQEQPNMVSVLGVFSHGRPLHPVPSHRITLNLTFGGPLKEDGPGSRLIGGEGKSTSI